MSGCPVSVPTLMVAGRRVFEEDVRVGYLPVPGLPVWSHLPEVAVREAAGEVMSDSSEG